MLPFHQIKLKEKQQQKVLTYLVITSYVIILAPIFGIIETTISHVYVFNCGINSIFT